MVEPAVIQGRPVDQVAAEPVPTALIMQVVPQWLVPVVPFTDMLEVPVILATRAAVPIINVVEVEVVQELLELTALGQADHKVVPEYTLRHLPPTEPADILVAVAVVEDTRACLEVKLATAQPVASAVVAQWDLHLQELLVPVAVEQDHAPVNLPDKPMLALVDPA